MSEEDKEPETTSEIEKIAAEGGWSPKDEWRGEEGNWKSAEDFVREGIKIQSKQHEKIERLQGTVDRVEENIKKMAQSESSRMKKALESQKVRLEQERQEAYDDQDDEKFKQADKELRDTDVQLNEINPVEEEYKVGEKAFVKNNEWYGKNKAMTAYTLAIAQNLRGAFPDLTVDEYYEELEKAAKDQFPNEFKNENRSRSSVSSDKPKGSQGKGNGFDALPPEAKEAYNEISMYSGISKADYAKQVNEQELL